MVLLRARDTLNIDITLNGAYLRKELRSRGIHVQDGGEAEDEERPQTGTENIETEGVNENGDDGAQPGTTSTTSIAPQTKIEAETHIDIGNDRTEGESKINIQTGL